MGGVLRIGAQEVQALKDAVARARARPMLIVQVMRGALPIDQSTDVVTLADRERALYTPERFAQHVDLPVGYRVSISFEEQPAGMCLHLSMSSGVPGQVPGTDAVTMVLTAIDMDGDLQEILDQRGGRVWFEHFLVNGKPGGCAVNVVLLIEESRAGHA